jgi:hypothetical protein
MGSIKAELLRTWHKRPAQQRQLLPQLVDDDAFRQGL